jgi:predicted Zn-dependent protease
MPVLDAPALDRIASDAERLLARSPADATLVTWIERRRGTARESARARRAELEDAREVIVRVRVAGRTGGARTESTAPSDLERVLRGALAAARAEPASPDWDAAASAGAVADLPGLFDPALAELEPAGAQRELELRAERRATIDLTWREERIVVAASFHPLRAVSLTAAGAAVRTGRRPGSGFAARSARTLAGLDLEQLVARARSLEAPDSVDEAPDRPLPLVLSPEVAAALVEAWGRVALSARGARETAARATLARGLTLDDEPLAARGLPLPFDLDGSPRSRRRFVDGGRVLGAAFDLELAARAGAAPTGHGLASDDAWPVHLALAPGASGEAELRARAAGGLRVGALEHLAVRDGDPALGFRAVARNVRRIGPDGTLGTGLAPLGWDGSLSVVLAAVEEVGGETATWAPRAGLPGATTGAALRLAAVSGFAPLGGGRT